ncbi:MAG: hypothetical protein V4496_05030 [Pseudomonadota bacterium]
MKFEKLGCVFTPDAICSWWHSHAMAPAPVQINDDEIRIYMGCWSIDGISRIGYIDVDARDPLKIINIAQKPVLDIGENGCFDENGVFPGHVTKIDNKIMLYYTGFQLGHKIPHYNFGGLAMSQSGKDFSRVSKAPILDRADEGLYVRAGQSVLQQNSMYHSVYSAGSGWVEVGGKSRPIYDIFYQASPKFDEFNRVGKIIVHCNHAEEHGLGRPQLVNINQRYYVFYTRRMLNMKYFFGYAYSDDLIHWERADQTINLQHGGEGEFDSEMVYFPAFIETKYGSYLFYSGNGFGKSGLGVARVDNF